MRIAVMQPYLFPYIGYFQLIHAVDKFVIFDDVHHIKRGFINRNYILVNGNAQRFTLQLKKSSQNKLINEIEIGENRAKIHQTIEITYKKAPYFSKIYPLISSIILFKENNLAKYVSNSLVKISEYIGLKTEFINSSDIKKDTALKGQEKIIDICKKLCAPVYVNAIGGQELYQKKMFEKENIKLFFLESHITTYKQFNNEFIPYLSIIDVLMFCSTEVIRKLISNYNLI